MTSLAPFIERRSTDRLKETPLRRRHGQVRRAQAPSRVIPTIAPQLLERRKQSETGFDAAATLELNLDRFPSKPQMMTFLKTLLYNAETGDLTSRRRDYVHALEQAVEVLQQSPEPAAAVATLLGYQAYMAQRGGTHHVQ